MKWLRYAGLAMFLTACSASAETFVAGKDYTVLSGPQPVETGARIELREFFWYGCGHCFAIEAPLGAYVKKLPKHVEFVRTPGMAPSWKTQAQAYFAFEALGVTDKVHSAFFDEWHLKKRPLHNEETIAAFVAEHGIDRTRFRQTFNSFGMSARLDRARQQNIAYVVEGVPMFAVDGRYTVTLAQGARGEKTDQDGIARTFRVLDFLIEKAAAERKKSAR